MTVERLDGCGGDAVAYGPAKATAGEGLVHMHLRCYRPYCRTK
jgi:hypothetical protein